MSTIQKTIVDAKAAITLVSDSTVDWLEYRLDINVKLVPGSGRPFPIVEIGGFSWYPRREQMVELRDKLSAYLEANPVVEPVEVSPRSQDGEVGQAREAKS